MGVVRFTAEAYARIQKALLPPGRLWKTTVGSFISAVFLGSGDELARVSGRAADMVEESDSSTAVELLPEFERELALPSTGTDSERQDRIVAQETKRPAFRPEDVKSALAPYLDTAVGDLVVLEISNANAILTGDEREVYRFYVHPVTVYGAGADLSAAQAELDAISHSHTLGFVIETTSFICGSPLSLVGRDVI